MGDRPAAPFVVGVARSGTTLLRMMLDAHPELAIPPETHFAAPVIAAFEGGGGGRDAAVRAMVGNRHWPDFGIPAEDFTRAAETAEPTAAGPLLRLFYETYAARAGKPRWGDKTPPYLDRMTSIQAVLPEAHFIHVIRDGRDVALSVIPLWFGPDDVTEAARHWSSRIEAARLQAGELEGYVEVRYEDLVGDCAATLERVCGEIGLPWDPAMLEYHRHAGERLTEVARDLRWHEGRTIAAATRSDIYRSAAEPPQGDRIGRWRREMSPADRSAFERIAGDLLGELGYAPA